MRRIVIATITATILVLAGCRGHGTFGRGAATELHESDMVYRWVWPKDDGVQCAVMRGPYDNDIAGWTVFTDWGNWDSPYHYFATKEQAVKFAEDWCKE